MNASEILRIVDAIHRDKNIDKEIVFEGVEAALVSALKKHYGEEAEIVVSIDRQSGAVAATCNGEQLPAEEVVGRIGAQTAKQVMIQKIREAERDALYDEYTEQIGEMVSGVIHRYEGAAATVALSNVEAILPRSEQIPGETHHVNERVRATVFEVRKSGSRVKVILSRTRPQLVQRLFEQEIPEINDGVIEVRAMAREPGYRSKVAVSSSDARVDCVGACVGVRGNRIKNIVDELGGERIDIVRWDDNLEVLIPNALQPAEVEQVILCKMLGRAIVLVREDQLSLAIGRRGQNVRLASKLSGWDIEIMTQEELAESIDRAVAGFSSLEGMSVELAERLVEEGFLSYDDLSVIEPDALMAMGELTEEEVDAIVSQAEEKAMEAEAAAQEARRKKREEDRLAAIEAEYAAAEAQTGGAGRIPTAPTTAAGGQGGEAAAQNGDTELTEEAHKAAEGTQGEPAS
ncbi:MAG: transcription termination factor NusA [Planctomycetota bacterium]|nr:MAG: transcription termination factor NusA [Planctomycetota bacterium]